MTEREWLESNDPVPMSEFLRRKKSRRKQRLFACACCRMVWEEIPLAWRQAVEVSEGYADDMMSKDQLLKAVTAAVSPWTAVSYAAQAAVFACDTTHSSHLVTRCAARSVASKEGGLWDPGILSREASLLRDVFTPFGRTRAINPAWLSRNGSTVRKLAQGIYSERDLPEGTLDVSRLRILADALEEAGCADQAILFHLRGPGPHVRGCWVVDLVLDKK
jgi:hypothetical protein